MPDGGKRLSRMDCCPDVSNIDRTHKGMGPVSQASFGGKGPKSAASGLDAALFSDFSDETVGRRSLDAPVASTRRFDRNEGK